MDFSGIKVGCHMLIKGVPCKVINVEKCKPGKHGSAKKIVTGIDVITDKKVIDTFRSNSIISTFNMKKDNYILVDVDDQHYFELMDNNNDMLSGIQMNNQSNVEKIRQNFDIGLNLECTLLTVQFDDKTLYRITDCKETKFD